MAQTRNRTRARMQGAAGFSLLELMVSTAVMLVVSGAALSSVVGHQKSYVSTTIQADMHSEMRNAVELLTQEVGQAGALNFTPTTLAASVAASPMAQSIPVGSTAGMFVGQRLRVDSGALEETVVVTALASNPPSISAVFAQGHTAGVLVTAAGVFPQGILSSSTPTSLRLFGDINADGNLAYVRYDCDTTAGTLTRSVTPLTSTTLGSSDILLSHVVPAAGINGCFILPAPTSVAGFTFTPIVGLTINVETARPDPQTGQFVVMSQNFLNIAPRNVQAGLDMANAGSVNNLQAVPPAVLALDAQ